MSYKSGTMFPPLARCRVRFLGKVKVTDPPKGGPIGPEELNMLQKPLFSCYGPQRQHDSVDDDARLLIFHDAIRISYEENPAKVEWLPMGNLHLCAALKYVNDRYQGEGADHFKFVNLDSPLAKVESEHPPLFALIMKRLTPTDKQLECYPFVCRNKDTAFALVEACSEAYRHLRHNKPHKKKEIFESYYDTRPTREGSEISRHSSMMTKGSDKMRMISKHPPSPPDGSATQRMYLIPVYEEEMYGYAGRPYYQPYRHADDSIRYAYSVPQDYYRHRSPVPEGNYWLGDRPVYFEEYPTEIHAESYHQHREKKSTRDRGTSPDTDDLYATVDKTKKKETPPPSTNSDDTTSADIHQDVPDAVVEVVPPSPSPPPTPPGVAFRTNIPANPNSEPQMRTSFFSSRSGNGNYESVDIRSNETGEAPVGPIAHVNGDATEPITVNGN